MRQLPYIPGNERGPQAHDGERDMLFRLLSTVMMLRMMSSHYAQEPVEEETKGGEGFGSVVGFVTFIATILVAAVIVLAILSLTGQFESDVIDPVT
jgi:uncharacterized membrane protein (DUF106 family)